MKQLFLSFFLMITMSLAHAKPTHPIQWHDGSVVLISGDTLTCKFSFTRKVKEGLLLIQEDNNTIQLLTVKQVRSFSYYDRQKEKQRYFHALNLQPELSGKKHLVFIERLYQGKNFWIVNHRTIGISKRTIQINPFRKKTIVENFYLVNTKTWEVEELCRENIIKMSAGNNQNLLSFMEQHGAMRTICDYIDVLEYHQASL